MNELLKALYDTHQYVQRTNEHLATLSQLQSLKAQKEKELASYKSEVYNPFRTKVTGARNCSVN